MNRFVTAVVLVFAAVVLLVVSAATAQPQPSACEAFGDFDASLPGTTPSDIRRWAVWLSELSKGDPDPRVKEAGTLLLNGAILNRNRGGPSGGDEAAAEQARREVIAGITAMQIACEPHRTSPSATPQTEPDRQLRRPLERPGVTDAECITKQYERGSVSICK